MSLRTFLHTKDVRKRFTAEFKTPELRPDWTIRVPPLTNHYSLVGVAFDYLLRFLLKYHNPQAEETAWVAEHALRRGWDPFLESCKKPKLQEASEVFTLLATDDAFLRETAERIMVFGKRSYQEYLDSGSLTDETLAATLLLAQLDAVHRAGYVDKRMGEVAKRDLEDLRNLISIVPLDDFKAESVCLLNPTFGKGSVLVRGADADLIIDETLLDIKTTKNCKFSRDMLNQLIGYYILAQIGGAGKCSLDGSKIRKLGFYFSRFGKTLLFQVDDIIDKETLPAFTNWFTQRAKKEFSL